jgi:hypothetical protein
MRFLLLASFTLLLCACEAESAPGEPPPPPPASDAGMCENGEGYTSCSTERFGYGTTCCGGREISFADGPCFPRGGPGFGDAGGGAPDDAGMNDGGMIDGGGPCDADPTADGCPCTTEGAVACRPYTWRNECRGGTWDTAFGYVCC